MSSFPPPDPLQPANEILHAYDQGIVGCHRITLQRVAGEAVRCTVEDVGSFSPAWPRALSWDAERALLLLVGFGDPYPAGMSPQDQDASLAVGLRELRTRGAVFVVQFPAPCASTPSGERSEDPNPGR